METCSLTQLKKGDLVTVDSIVANPAFGELDSMVSRRLADLGFSQGMPLMMVATGLGGKGPFAIRLNHLAQFSLRYDEAQKIMCCRAG